jgi:hypothetical protein
LVKQFSNWLSLAFGIVLLSFGVFCFHELASNGRAWWRQHRFTTRPKANSGVNVRTGSNPLLYELLGDQAALSPKSATEKKIPTSVVDRVASAGDGRPNHILHKRISLETYKAFAFDVPPHSAHPRLEGTFRTAQAGQRAGMGVSVEVLLMTETQFEEFSQNYLEVSTQAERPANHGDIEWDLTPTFGNRECYYLVFRNSSKRTTPTLVDADFTATFE